MQAQERVYQQLKKMTEETGRVTAAELAKGLNLSRQVTSHYLNRLLEQNRAEKTSSRPVYWMALGEAAGGGDEMPDYEEEEFFAGEPEEESGIGSLILPEEPEDRERVFSELIGAYGSLRNITLQCMAAVNYPPDGLPILIIGESGVGKSYLAGLIHQYALSQQVMKADAPFAVLNCADYANNPELLSAALFGYKKGSFTGAVSDKQGLLKEADGGILFLDEVHRLSYENQEKLFVFMDTGRYHALGDSAWKEAKVRFIFATTEEPELVLLETFRRRITVQLRMLSMTERPLKERLELLNGFYEKEARKVGRDILVDKKVVSLLCFSRMKGNIGKLKNLVQLSCANAYFRQSNQRQLSVTMSDLPPETWMASAGSMEELGTMKVFAEAKAAEITGGQQEGTEERFACLLETIGQTGFDSYQKDAPKYLLEFKKSVREILRMNPEREGASGSLIKDLFAKICRRVLARYGIIARQELIDRMYLVGMQYGQTAGGAGNGKAGTYFETVMPRAYYVAGRLTRALKEASIADHSYIQGLFAWFLSDFIREDIAFLGLIVAHGDSTASSIQAVANQVCGTYIFESIDMPMDTSVAETVDKVKQFLEHEDTGRGVILLVDMGSLSQMYSSIKSSVSGDLLIINNLTTCIALDIGFKIAGKTAFKEIAEAADDSYRVSVQYFEGVAKGNNIVVSCMSGVGIAEKIKDMLVRVLGDDSLDILAMEYRQLQQLLTENQEEYFEKTKLILTTSNLEIKTSVPWMNIYDLMDGQGERRLWSYLRSFIPPEKLDLLNREFVKFFSMEGIVSRLQFLNPAVVINEVEHVILKYEQQYRMEFSGRIRLNLYMHIAFMIERLMVSDSGGEEVYTPAPGRETEFYRVSREIFRDIEKRYHIVLNHYEISLLYELFGRVIQ